MLQLIGGPLPHLRLPLPAPTPVEIQPSTPAPPTATSDPTMTEHPDRDTVTLQRWAKETQWSERARLALPWRFGLGTAIRGSELPDGVAEWAKKHTITDRARLLLPWKWGLLPRSMEGRW